MQEIINRDESLFEAKLVAVNINNIFDHNPVERIFEFYGC